ncbi:hypothetical protein D3C71_77730 [compost metagenome]
MNFNINPRPLHPVLDSFVQLVHKALPYREPAEGEESQSSVIWHVFDHLTDCPGVQLEMRLHQAVYVAKFKVNISHVAGYGMFTEGDDAVTLLLERTPTHAAHARDFGPRQNGYRRTLRNGNGNLTIDLDQFLKQVVESVVFFFTNHYPGTMPEFSSWLHSSASSMTADVDNQQPARAGYVQPVAAAPLETPETKRGFPSSVSSFPHDSYLSRQGLPTEDTNSTTNNETP